MSTETAHESVAKQSPQGANISQATNRISGLLNPLPAEQPEQPKETPRERRVKEAAKQPEPEETPDQEDVEEEPGEEPEVEAKEADTEVEEESEEGKEQEDASQAELEPAQLAALLGVDESDIDIGEDGSLSYNVKVDGKPGKATLQDLRDSYQLAKTHQQRLNQLSNERKEFDAQKGELIKGLSDQHEQMAQALNGLAEEFNADYNSVDWNKLREEDPSEYNARRWDFEERRQRLESYKTKAEQQAKQLQQEHRKALQQQQVEGAKQLSQVFEGPEYKGAPKWDDAEKTRLATWLKDQGFKDDDIASVGVWQVFKWARDSMLREQELKQAKDSVKKVAKLPKVVKPGKRKDERQMRRSQMDQLRAKHRKSRNLRSAEALISGMLRK